MKMNRRQSREAAFSLIFEWSFHQEATAAMMENAIACRELVLDDFSRALCERTIDNCEELDQIIERYSESWKLTRLSKVTLAVLRMAFCEMTSMEGIPAGATINEAVELCKKFTTEDEAAYVNGILGQYTRDQGGEVTAPEAEAPEHGEEALAAGTAVGDEP